MSDTIPEPWICKYLIDVAEEYGGDLHNVPLVNKSKRVQLIEFLSIPSPKDNHLWARISDKAHKVTVRFSGAALEGYSNRDVNGRKLIERRNAVIFVKYFRPFFSRVPVSVKMKKMSSSAHIVLDIDYINFIGGDGERIYGEPKDVETDDKLGEWTEGLRKDGGGGNVLKIRKEQKKAEGRANQPPISCLQQPKLSRLPSKPAQPEKQKKSSIVAQEAVAQSSAVSTAQASRSDPMKGHNRLWRLIRKNPQSYCPTMEKTNAQVPTIPREGGEDSKDAVQVAQIMPSSVINGKKSTPPPHSPAKAPEHTKQSTPTPSEWAPTEFCSSPHESSPHETGMDPSNADDNMENQNSAPSKASKETRLSTPITHSPEIPYPTPAQRTKSRSRLPPSVHPRTSSPPLPSVPDSPFPPSPSLHLPARKTVLRRVPHPGIPPPPDPNVSGPGRVLVPNSDTSGTASQPSQPPPQPYESSQYLPLPPSSLPVSFGVNSQSTGNAPRKYLTKMMESSLLRPTESEGLLDNERTSLNDLPANSQNGSQVTEPVFRDNDKRQVHPNLPVIDISDDEAETDTVLSPLFNKPQSTQVSKAICKESPVKSVVPAVASAVPSSSGAASQPSQYTAFHSLFSQSSSEHHSFQTDAVSASTPIPTKRETERFSVGGDDPSTSSTHPDVTKSKPDSIEHIAAAWARPSFMNIDRKGKGRAIQVETGPEGNPVRNKRQLEQKSPSPSSRKKKRVLDNVSQLPSDGVDGGTPRLKTSRPRRDPTKIKMHTSGSSGSREGGRVKSSVNTSEYLRSREGSRPGSKIENEVSKIMGESIASQNTTGSTLMNDSNIQGHDGLQRERLAGFIVDFDQIPMSVVDRKPMWMGWKQMEAILLRTGRLRTLAQNGRSITDTGT